MASKKRTPTTSKSDKRSWATRKLDTLAELLCGPGVSATDAETAMREQIDALGTATVADALQRVAAHESPSPAPRAQPSSGEEALADARREETERRNFAVVVELLHQERAHHAASLEREVALQKRLDGPTHVVRQPRAPHGYDTPELVLVRDVSEGVIVYGQLGWERVRRRTDTANGSVTIHTDVGDSTWTQPAATWVWTSQPSKS